MHEKLQLMIIVDSLDHMNRYPLMTEADIAHCVEYSIAVESMSDMSHLNESYSSSNLQEFVVKAPRRKAIVFHAKSPIIQLENE